MKTSLTHLPGNKQSEIMRIVDIIREVVNPEMIILFGSYAKGGWKEHRYQSRDGVFYEYVSDYDFLVITQKVTTETSDQEWAIEERAKADGPVNLEIHEIDFVNKGIEAGQYFFMDIIKEGILLYTTKSVEFSKPLELSIARQREIAEEYFQAWFSQASEFLIDARNALSRKSLRNATFYLHQSAESLYYTTLLVCTGYKPKTHNLKKLRKKAKNLSLKLFLLFPVESNSKEKQLFEQLKQGYIDARYKKNFSISEETVQELMERVEGMKEIVLEISHARISSLK